MMLLKGWSKMHFIIPLIKYHFFFNPMKYFSLKTILCNQNFWQKLLLNLCARGQFEIDRFTIIFTSNKITFCTQKLDLLVPKFVSYVIQLYPPPHRKWYFLNICKIVRIMGRILEIIITFLDTGIEFEIHFMNCFNYIYYKFNRHVDVDV